MKEITKSLLLIILTLIAIPSLLLNYHYFFQEKKEAEQNRVASVVDGDTFVLKTGQRIRLSNIEAPEIEFCGGEKAKARLKELILNKIVKIETNTEDVFNRTLGMVYVNDTLVNEVLLREGLARYDGTPGDKRDQLKAAYDSAVAGKKGIHGPPCRSEKPDRPKCLIKGNISRSNNDKWYFFPGCQSYEVVLVEKDLGESWFCNEKEALAAGYKKGANCQNKTFKVP